MSDKVFVVDSAAVAAKPGSTGLLPEAPLAFVVIGPGWSGREPGSGGRGIDDPTDPVHVEVAGVLERSTFVVPVLVGGEPMPTADDLPSPFRGLARMAPVELSDDHFRADVDRLSATVMAVVHDVRRRDAALAGGERLAVVFAFAVFATAGMIVTPLAVAAMAAALWRRRGIRHDGGGTAGWCWRTSASATRCSASASTCCGSAASCPEPSGPAGRPVQAARQPGATASVGSGEAVGSAGQKASVIGRRAAPGAPEGPRTWPADHRTASGSASPNRGNADSHSSERRSPPCGQGANRRSGGRRAPTSPSTRTIGRPSSSWNPSSHPTASASPPTASSPQVPSLGLSAR